MDIKSDIPFNIIDMVNSWNDCELKKIVIEELIRRNRNVFKM